jgi:uncharacterized protein (TIGR03086 family)
VTALDHAVELLDRALSYTQGTLHDVTDADLPRRTPCERWDLGQLLAHMEDALDAFAEGAHGSVDLHDRVPVTARVASLQEKACSLLAAWSQAPPERVRIGEHSLDTHVVALAAALEITIHGWDVAQAIGSDRRIPDDLAHWLLPVAEALVADADRGPMFGPPRPVPSDAHDDARLLGFLGRDGRHQGRVTGPEGQITGIRGTGDAAAS